MIITRERGFIGDYAKRIYCYWIGRHKVLRIRKFFMVFIGRKFLFRVRTNT